MVLHVLDAPEEVNDHFGDHLASKDDADAEEKREESYADDDEECQAQDVVDPEQDDILENPSADWVLHVLYRDIPGESVHGERANFTGLVLGCIEAKFCK